MPDAPAAAPPAAPAAPASQPPPPPPTEREPADYMADAMTDFAEMDSGKPAPSVARDEKGKFKPAEKAPAKPVTKPKPDATKPPEDATKPPEDATKPPEDETTPKPGDEKRPAGLRALGEAYDSLKKKVNTELQPEIQRLRAKITEYETKPPEDSAPLVQKLKAVEARNAELEKHISYVDYTQSQEFATKYAQPYREAWDNAVTDFRQLRVREQTGEDEDGTPIFKVRPANEADLLHLANMELSDMDEAANKIFGASAARAISHIENLKRLSAAKNRAEDEAKKKAVEWRTQQQAEMQNRSQTLAKTWTEVNKSLQERYPKAFTPEEGNAEDKEAHTKGFAVADLLFIGERGLTPEQIEALPGSFKDTLKAGKMLSETQRVQLHALARLKIANHDRKVRALNKANARIKELETALAQYERSEPDAGSAGDGTRKGGGAGKDWLQTAEDELRALDRG